MDDSDETFTALVQRTVSNGDATALGRILGVNTATVHRWARGESRPHPGVRPIVCARMRELQQRHEK